MNNCDNRRMDKYTSCPGMNKSMQKPLAMAYVPWQYLNNVYEPDKALMRGTIFPELDLPFLGRRGACR